MEINIERFLNNENTENLNYYVSKITISKVNIKIDYIVNDDIYDTNEFYERVERIVDNLKHGEESLTFYLTTSMFSRIVTIERLEKYIYDLALDSNSFYRNIDDLIV